MVVVRVSKKMKDAFLLSAFVFLIGFNIYAYNRNAASENQDGTKKFAVNGIGRSSMAAFLVSSEISVRNIEIFDITKGEVIQKTPVSSLIQKEVEGYLDKVTGVYVKAKAFPDKGYIIRVPFDPATEVKNTWLSDYGIKTVDQVFILFPEEDVPYLLVLDENRRPFFYNFEGNTKALLEMLGF